MVLNIPVPITELERKGTLIADNLFIIEAGDITKNITWSGLLTRVTTLPDTLIFGFGSVELPSICFVDSFSGFYAPQLGSVAVSTGHTEKLAIRPGGLIEFGDPLLKETSLTTIKSEARLKCNSSFLESVIIEKNLQIVEGIKFNGDVIFNDINIIGDGNGDNLVVYGDRVVFGNEKNPCQQTFLLYNESNFKCNVNAKENVTVTLDLNNSPVLTDTTFTIGPAAPGSTDYILEVKRESLLNVVDTLGDVVVDDGSPSSFTKEGNITTSGDVNVGGVISGDGQGITNLNIPGSLRLKGSIDPTTQGPPDPPQHGDLWYSSADGNFNVNWIGLGGEPVTIGRYFYYFATPTPQWVLGAISELQSPVFMKIDLTQTATGAKSFSEKLVVQAQINTTDIQANKLKLENGKATSAFTVTTDSNNTITTKSYVDGRMNNSTFLRSIRPKTPGYIIGQSYNGSVTQTWGINASSIGSGNIVKRNDEGNFSANVITATFLDGIATDTKTLDIFQSDSDSEHPVTLVTSTGQSRQVYSDSDFTYNPVTDTLSVGSIIGEVTGDVTGNIDTATKFQTARTLWGQSFDGTSDVNGDVTNAGNITSQENNTKDIGADNNVFSDVYSNNFHGTLLGDVTIGDSLRNDLTGGNHILGGLWNGSTEVTWTVDGTPDSVNGKIVIRDTLGNFSSDRIEATNFIGHLTGNVTGNTSGSSSSVTGNAATATKFQNSRLLWTQPFDGTSNVDNSIVNVNDILPSTGSTYDIGSESLPFSTLYVDEIFGDVDNNAISTDKLGHALGRGDYIEGTYTQWDGSLAETWSIDPRSSNEVNKIVNRNENGNFAAGTITASFVGDLTGRVIGDISGSSGSVTGNANSATKLQTPRQLWGNLFDGTQNISSNLNSTGNIIPSGDNQYDLGKQSLQYNNVYAETFQGNIKNNIEVSDGLENYLNIGNYLLGQNWNGSEQATWSVFSHSENIEDSVVNRDSSGSFAANVITSNIVGDFTGNVTGNLSGNSNEVTGNAASCTRLVTERKVDIKFEGFLTGSGTFGYLGGDQMELIAPVEVTQGEVDIRDLEPLPE